MEAGYRTAQENDEKTREEIVTRHERNAQKIYWRMCKIKGQKQVNEAWERNLKIVGIIEYEDGSYWIVQKPREYP